MKTVIMLMIGSTILGPIEGLTVKEKDGDSDALTSCLDKFNGRHSGVSTTLTDTDGSKSSLEAYRRRADECEKNSGFIRRPETFNEVCERTMKEIGATAVRGKWWSFHGKVATCFPAPSGLAK